MVEESVSIQTSDGTADGFLFRPDDGRSHRGVLFLPDGRGVRESQRDMSRRVAADGYVVLLPNIYYRTAREPFFTGPLDFTNAETKARFEALTGALTPEKMEEDGRAFVDFLQSRELVEESPVCVVGFCFTGQYSLRVAAALGDGVAAAASFHGGGLWKDAPNSPHLVLPRVTARLYFGHARDDRGMPAEAIANFETALREWGGSYESETYDALHGWTVPDSAAYNEPEAERAFAKLRTLFAAH